MKNAIRKIKDDSFDRKACRISSFIQVVNFDDFFCNFLTSLLTLAFSHIFPTEYFPESGFLSVEIKTNI